MITKNHATLLSMSSIVDPFKDLEVLNFGELDMYNCPIRAGDRPIITVLGSKQRQETVFLLSIALAKSTISSINLSNRALFRVEYYKNILFMDPRFKIVSKLNFQKLSLEYALIDRQGQVAILHKE